MSKVDWDFHFKNYASLCQNEHLNYRQYAERYSLNPNTLRRAFAKESAKGERASDSDQFEGDHPPKSDHFEVDHSPKSDHARGKKRARGSDNERSSSGHKKDNIKNNKDISYSGRRGSNNSADPAGKVFFLKSTNASEGDHPKNAHSKAAKRGTGKPFKKGNEASVKTGGRAKPRAIDYQQAEQDLEAGVPEMSMRTIMESTAHMYRVRAAIAVAVNVMDAEIEDASVPKDDDEESLGPHPSIKKAKFLMDAAYLFNTHQQTLNSINLAIQKQELEARKTAVSETKLAIALRDADVIQEAIRLRDENGWDDLQTVEYIESFAVKPPPTMLARAMKTIAAMQPDSDDGGVDDEELDREARKFREQQANAADFVAERHAMVAGIVDSMGLGDYDAEGVRRSGELDQDEELDFDYEATADLYDEPETAIPLSDGDDE